MDEGSNRSHSDVYMTGCFGVKHSNRWCGFLMTAAISWVVLLFALAMIVLTLYVPNGQEIQYNQLIIWTNLVTIIVGVWLPQPRNKGDPNTLPI